MINFLQSNFSAHSRRKIYLIFAFISLILLIISIRQIYPVMIEVNDPLGLASHLTASYWIGLALMILVSITAFLDRDLNHDVIFLILLISLGLFLFGIGVFAYENARIPDVYYPISEVNLVLTNHHIDIASPESLFTNLYYSWPVVHFISASLLSITGIGLTFVKYVPLFYILMIILITYSIGQRLEMKPNRCFLLSFLVLSSWQIMYHYAPNALGAMLYLVIMIFLIFWKSTKANISIIILLLGTLAMTHGLSLLATAAGLVILAIYKRKTIFIVITALFILGFAGWMMYAARQAVGISLTALLDFPLFHLRQATEMARYTLPSATARAVARYAQLSYVAIWGIPVIISVVLLLRRRITGKLRQQVLPFIFFAIGPALLVFLNYGQMLYRVYVFCLIPVVCIIVLSLAGRRLARVLMIVLICVLPFINLLATYAVDVSWPQVLTTELRGGRFFALEVEPKPTDKYFCPNYNPVFYYNSKWQEAHISIPPDINEKIDISFLDKQNYVILSRQASNTMNFERGEDLYSTWPQTEAGEKTDLIYDNGSYQIYRNRLDKP